MLREVMVLAVAAVAASGAQETERTIRGNVRDSSGHAVPHALIQTTGQSRVATDDNGAFDYRTSRKGELRFLVRRLGYSPLELVLNPSRDTTVVIVLAAIPRRFDAIVVEARKISARLHAVGFYDRMNQRNKGTGSGTFITVEDIAQRQPLRISQMLDQIGSLKVFKASADFDDYVFRGPGGPDGICPYTVYLDGTRIGPRLGGSSKWNDEVRIDRFLEPSATGGIEVYPRATSAPPHLQMLNGTCGVVAFWTK
jgi:hypothetical protein